MGRFYGKVGYGIPTETSPGIWKDVIVELTYAGDVNKISKRNQSTEYLNDNIVVNNEISIVADPLAFQNFQYIQYVSWMGTNWKVNSVTVQYPRLVINIGGVYNGPTP